MRLHEAARGRWFELLTGLGGIGADFLDDRHGPCPFCGGEDRWRWDDRGGDGGGYCNQCGGPQGAGGSISGLDLLMRARDWDLPTAAKRVEEALGMAPEEPTPAKRNRREYRKPEKPPVDAPPPALDGAVAQWCYRNEAGEQLFWIQRVNLAKGGKCFVYRTWLDGRWYRPSKKHEFTAEWPAPRPIYGLERLKAEGVVVIGEGEKVADFLLERAEGRPVVSWANGAKAISKTDWTPLRGRDVIVCPDNDKDGRLAVSSLRVALMAVGVASFGVCKPPEGKPEGWDAADETEWDELDVGLWLTGAEWQEVEAAVEVPAPAREREEEGEAAPILVRAQKLEANELLMMLRHQSDRIRYNVFTQQLEINSQPLLGADRFYLKLAEMGYKVTKQVAMDCLVHIGQENKYDPVVEYLNYVGDNVQPGNIEVLATTYLRPGDNVGSLYDEMLKRTLIGAVRRAFEPGCKHDTACVLAGDQGGRKSSFWAALGGGFFSDALGDISSKDDLMVLHRSWIMEWAELDHLTGRRHAGQVKAFLSQATDTFRVPYGTAAEAFPRRGVIVGSTNKSTGFLVDETGNRRFWVIPTPATEVDPIDVESLLGERDALWAAAVLAYRAGERNYLTSEQALQVQRENQEYVVESPWASVIEAWMTRKVGLESVTTEQLLLEAVQKPTERQTRADQMAIAEILKGLGWERRRGMDQGSRRWRWHRCPTY